MADLPNLAHPDDDPFLWLEEVDGARACAWADAQSTATMAAYDSRAFRADRDTLRTLLDRPDNLPMVTRRGGLLYNFWKDAAHARGLWRRTTLDSYRTDAPAWETLLDLDALAAAEGEDWVWQGAQTLPPVHDRALLRLSRGGGDAVVLREYAIGARAFVEGGFALPEAKSDADWLDQDTLLLTSALGGATASGYGRTVRLWARGEDHAAAKILFEVAPDAMAAAAGYDRATGQLYFVAQTGFFDAEISVGGRHGPDRRIDLPTDARVQWDADWLVFRLRTPWDADGQTYGPDTLLGIGFEDFMAGGRGFQTLFVPEARRSLQTFFWSDGKLILSILDDLRPSFLSLAPGAWTGTPLAMPALGTVSAWPLDAEDTEQDGTLLASVQDPLTPPSLGLVRDGAYALAKSVAAAFDASSPTLTRHEALSTDGERIPYFQIGPERPTGDAPVHMTAYGGFGLSMLPGYRAGMGKLWLEPGGTAVIACIRGGGEFGTRWHEAGRREGKFLAHEDFAAVAADLVARGVTRPGRIAAEGGSNGGLLIANMLTRYPERFGALFCTIPLIDMRRYTKLLAGASWIAEYGDPDVPGDWAFLRRISAYQVAEPGRPYPPILLATARRDDRVHPAHARKMAAKLLAMGYDAAFYEPAAGGHGYGKDNGEAASFVALGLTFLKCGIGWTG